MEYGPGNILVWILVLQITFIYHCEIFHLFRQPFSQEIMHGWWYKKIRHIYDIKICGFVWFGADYQTISFSLVSFYYKSKRDLWGIVKPWQEECTLLSTSLVSNVNVVVQWIWDVASSQLHFLFHFSCLTFNLGPFSCENCELSNMKCNVYETVTVKEPLEVVQGCDQDASQIPSARGTVQYSGHVLLPEWRPLSRQNMLEELHVLYGFTRPRHPSGRAGEPGQGEGPLVALSPASAADNTGLCCSAENEAENLRGNSFFVALKSRLTAATVCRVFFLQTLPNSVDYFWTNWTFAWATTWRHWSRDRQCICSCVCKFWFWVHVLWKNGPFQPNTSHS